MIFKNTLALKGLRLKILEILKNPYPDNFNALIFFFLCEGTSQTFDKIRMG